MEKGKFIKVKCPKCGKNSVVFGKASTDVKCSNCNKLLVKTTGGKAKVKGKVREVI